MNNCEARVFITSHARKEVVQPLVGKMPLVEQCYMLDGTIDGFASWEDAIAAMPDQPIADQSEAPPCSIPPAQQVTPRA